MYFIKFKNVAIICLLFLVAVSFFVGKSVMTSTENVGIELPIIMYHHCLKSDSRLGEFIISPTDFEKDLKYLKDNGYQTVGINELIDYVYEGKPLAEKPVMITVDDGYLSTKEYMYPLLSEYGYKAVVSVLGKASDDSSTDKNKNVSYSHLSWENIKELDESGIIEFQNHTYDMHSLKGRKGCMKKASEGTQTYKRTLEENLTRVQDKLCEVTGKTPKCFTYPYGFISAESVDVVKDMGFLATLSCEEGINYITNDYNCLFRLKRINRTHKNSVEFILKRYC